MEKNTVVADISRAYSPSQSQKNPLLLLFTKLISNDDINSILTEDLLLCILKYEFNIKICEDHHEFEVQVYMSVLESFIKKWQWKNYINFIFKYDLYDQENIINSIKKILKPLLEIAEKSAKNAIDTGEVVSKEKICLEVQCTRKHLDKLVYRYPFICDMITFTNLNDIQCNRIITNAYNLKRILNSHVRLSVTLPGITYNRKTSHIQKFSLVNLKLPKPQKEITVHNTNLQRQANVIPQVLEKECALDIISSKLTECAELSDFHTVLLDTIRNDVKQLNTVLITKYRMYPSKYNYIRYMCSEPHSTAKVDNRKYDLSVRETTTPVLEFGFTISANDNANFSDSNLEIECTYCGLLLKGVAGLTKIVDHFNNLHAIDDTWLCEECMEGFSYYELLDLNWQHVCEVPTFP